MVVMIVEVMVAVAMVQVIVEVIVLPPATVVEAPDPMRPANQLFTTEITEFIPQVAPTITSTKDTLLGTARLLAKTELFQELLALKLE